MHINSTKGPLSSSVGRPGRVAHEIIKLQPSHVWLVEGGEREDIEWGVDDTLEDIVVAIHVALLALILLASATAIAGFFAVPGAAPALQAIALVPLAKGFLSLDMRLRQRDLDNRAFVAVEALPQVIALALTVPALKV